MYPSIEMINKNKNLKNYKRVAIAREIYADFITPIEIIRKLKAEHYDCFLLESVEQRKYWGRYTFIGFNPKLKILANKGKVQIIEKENITTTQNPKQTIREILAKYKTLRFDDMPPFCGGLVGFVSYDYIRYNEPKLDFKQESEFGDLDLMLFDEVIVFDNFKQKIKLIAGVDLEDLKKSYELAKTTLQNIESLIKTPCKNVVESFCLKSQPTPHFSQEEYIQIVQKAKRYIYEGDIFQVVLSNALKAKANGSLFDVYRALRTTNPSPYMFYLCENDIEIAGSSPETLLRLEDSKVYTYPLAGSYKRGKTQDEDERFKQILLNDEKEKSEHNMLVDLGRNDVGKIAKFGSVKVEKYMNVEFYSHIMHLSSTICGEILEDKDALDALESILPAGTLSGAPKIRACEIINELEGDSRGVYGGGIGYFDFSGGMDMCIAIRLAYKKGDEVYIRSGAGIVYDSNPKNEFLECNNKAKAILDALQTAHKGLI